MSIAFQDNVQLPLFDCCNADQIESYQPNALVDLEREGIHYREIGEFHRFRVFLVDGVKYTGDDWLYAIRPRNEIVSGHDLKNWSALVRVARHYRKFGEPTALLKHFSERRMLSLEGAAANILGDVELTATDVCPLCEELHQYLTKVFFDFLQENNDEGYNWVGYDIVMRF